MGGVSAELLAKNGADVALMTPDAYVSDWTVNTLEQAAIYTHLVDLGVDIDLNRGITETQKNQVQSNCVYTGNTKPFDCDCAVMEASRLENNALFSCLEARQMEWADHGMHSVKITGDAEAPGPISWATCAGHRYARELDKAVFGDTLSFRREITE